MNFLSPTKLLSDIGKGLFSLVSPEDDTLKKEVPDDAEDADAAERRFRKAQQEELKSRRRKLEALSSARQRTSRAIETAKQLATKEADKREHEFEAQQSAVTIQALVRQRSAR